MLASGARRVKLYCQKLGAKIYEVKQARNGLQSIMGTILKRNWGGLIKMINTAPRSNRSISLP
jgi:hypothetical protein